MSVPVLGREPRPGATAIVNPPEVRGKGNRAGTLDHSKGTRSTSMAVAQIAYTLVYLLDGEERAGVVAGPDFADAAETALDRLGRGTHVVRMVELGPVLAALTEPAPQPQQAAEKAQPTLEKAPEKVEKPGPAAPRPGTRLAQLVAFLRQHGEVHLDQVAADLQVKRGHADDIARTGVRQGLVERVGRRTGRIRLVGAVAAEPERVPAVVAPDADDGALDAVAGGEGAQKAQPRPHSGTRTEQLVELLAERGGELHITEIAEGLGTNRGNAGNVVTVALKAGRIERVGRRTGRVRLVTVEPAELERKEIVEPPEEAEEPPRAALDPEALMGLQRRVWEALDAMRGWRSAKDVAGRLGCRPREAGNALTLLVEAGVVKRQMGQGTPERPSDYWVRGL